jgi:choice-of-anchor A domain-containing protein
MTSTTKRVLAAVFAVVAIVAIAVALKYTVGMKNSSSTGSSNGSSRAGSVSGTDSNGNPVTDEPGVTDAPGATPTPSDSVTDTPSPVPTDAPATVAPTQAPTPPNFSTCKVEGQLGFAKWFNAMFSGEFWGNNSEVGGRLAVGGDTLLNFYAIGSGLYGNDNNSLYFNCPQIDLSNFSDADYALQVDGTLSINGSRISNGGMLYGTEGSLNYTEASIQDNCPVTSTTSLVFSATSGYFSQLRAASDKIAALPTTGWSKASYDANSLTLTFTLNGSTMQEYFSIEDAWLNNARALVMEGSQLFWNESWSTIIIDVKKTNGNDAIFCGNYGLTGFDDKINYIMWNFNGFTNFTLQNAFFPGSVLAVDATFEKTIGTFKGNVYGKSWNIDHDPLCASIQNYAFNGTLFSRDC